MNQNYSSLNFGQDAFVRSQIRRAGFIHDEATPKFYDRFGPNQISSGRWSSFVPVSTQDYTLVASRHSAAHPYKIFGSQEMTRCVQATNSPSECSLALYRY